MRIQSSFDGLQAGMVPPAVTPSHPATRSGPSGPSDRQTLEVRQGEPTVGSVCVVALAGRVNKLDAGLAVYLVISR
jgi:hypothetical protein